MGENKRKEREEDGKRETLKRQREVSANQYSAELQLCT